MATKAQQKENLEKVTDYVEERVLDADRMAKAMSSLESDKSGARAEAAKQARYVRACVFVFVCLPVCVYFYVVLAPALLPCKRPPSSLCAACASLPPLPPSHRHRRPFASYPPAPASFQSILTFPS